MSKSAASTGASVVGLVRSGPCDTSISRALQTCVASGITKVIVVDDMRAQADYDREPLVSKGMVQVLCEKDMFQAERRLSENSCSHASYVIDLPPTFLHAGRGLIETMTQHPSASLYRQLAVAPRYQTPDDYGGVGFLFLMTHLMWTFFSLVTFWRSYRGTYAVLRAVLRERGVAVIAKDTPAPWRKMDAALFGPVPEVGAPRVARVLPSVLTPWPRQGVSTEQLSVHDDP